ncbi:hypothetical protein [Pseudomonas phage 67PfluR64PP]|uniref:Uncharacterized protein n=1 Tax=Pseudomonas phage 67PfluR64PP TaxID=2163980 RepID=A0A2S1PGU5_9CAUD|nr:hypothetical protein [Pseudomonas phage 67PfluR64PP]
MIPFRGSPWALGPERGATGVLGGLVYERSLEENLWYILEGTLEGTLMVCILKDT